MGLKLREGDYVPDGAGGFLTAQGDDGILEEALFRLTARRGGFSPMPELGSRLYLLGRAKAEARNALARTYAQEALSPMGLRVLAAEVLENGDRLLVTVTAADAENTRSLEVRVQ